MQKEVLRDTRSRALVILPLVSGLWLAIGVGIIGALTPDFSHISQFMSALGAAGTPLGAWTNYAVFIPVEIWLLVFLILLNKRFHDSLPKRFSMLLLFSYPILLIFVALLPCDAGCDIVASDESLTNTVVHVAHMAIAVTAYPIALIGLLILSLTARSTSFLRRFAILATVVGFCLFLAIGLVPQAQGLFQRLLEAWIYVQLLVLGLYAASIVPPADRGIE